jgi:hypothetical protein
LVEESGQSESGQSHESPLSGPELISEDFSCDICDKSFGTENSLKAHRLRAHRKSANWSNEDKAAKASDANDEQEIADDFRRQSRTASQALSLARNQSRLKNTNPHMFRELYGHEEDGSPTKAIVDLEVAKTLRAMRQEEPSHQNNGDSSETALLKKEVTDLKEALRQKDLQSLRDENAKINEELKEIRSEMRSLPNSSSDLAALVKSTENIIIKAVESEGPLRRYLLPDSTIPIKAPGDAPPLLRVQPAGNNVLEELKKHNLVTRIVDVQKGGA